MTPVAAATIERSRAPCSPILRARLRTPPGTPLVRSPPPGMPDCRKSLLSYTRRVPTEQDVRVYARPDGTEPFTSWLRDLRDGKSRGRIRQRIARVRLGNLGDAKTVGDGVQELRIPFGPGFRVYFGRKGDSIVILLCGGDKSTQGRDIDRAKEYWRDYRSRDHG